MADTTDLLPLALAHHQAGRLDQARALYLQVLAIQPRNHDALHLLGVLTGNAGEPEAGLALMREAVRLQPRLAPAHFNQGLLLQAMRQHEAALQSLDACLTLNPAHPGALAAAGRSCHALGRHEAAAAHFERATRADPANPHLWNDLGSALYGARRFQQACAAYEHALCLNPGFAAAHRNRGAALLLTGRTEEAIAAFQAALALAPDDRSCLLSLAAGHEAAGDPDAALTALEPLLQRNPADEAAHLRRAALLCSLERFDAAIDAFSAVLATNPDHPEALAGRGGALWLRLDPDAAAADLDRALAIKPDLAPALVDRGNVYQDRSEFAEAVALYDRALAIDPAHLPALRNRAVALQALQDHDRALAACEALVRAAPDDADARMSLGMCQLRMGLWQDGWRGYESRLDLPLWRNALTTFGAPRWDGKADIAGKRFLLAGEQGLGDIIQFSRFAPLLAARGAHVILGVEPPLRRLMQGMAGVAEIAVSGDAVEYDLYCLCMSIPALLDLTEADFATNGPYLHADPGLATEWRRRLERLPGLKIGLAWAGDPRPHDHMAARIDRRRSVALSRLAPILRAPGVTFVSLQKGAAAAQAAGLPLVDWTAELEDYADTAALMTALDLVICVDTSVGHAAGALGVPVWVLNRYDRCWRWLWGREDTAWYPTMRLFTQRQPGGWDALAQEVAQALGVVAGTLGP